MNHILVESACNMLKNVGFSNFLRRGAIATCYVQNQSPTKVIVQKIPYELWHGAKPNVTHLHVFGCDAHIHVLEELRQKLDSKNQKCIFIGYNDEVKGFKFYDPQNKKLLISHDVIFDETLVLQVSRTMQGEKIHKSIEPSQMKKIQVHHQIQRKKNGTCEYPLDLAQF
jgi:hypothetical protein